ncbi:MAG: hypothetical protein J7647_13715 [Cyanobacteria bacterium SBLK]|nr:hypothetical protein [Cyanobacteria bacterium SBLK]
MRIFANGNSRSQEVQAKIFEQGFAPKSRGKGIDWQMAISYRIIAEKREGFLVCYLELGKGTEFIISLPCQGMIRKNDRNIHQ